MAVIGKLVVSVDLVEQRADGSGTAIRPEVEQWCRDCLSAWQIRRIVQTDLLGSMTQASLWLICFEQDADLLAFRLRWL